MYMQQLLPWAFCPTMNLDYLRVCIRHSATYRTDFFRLNYIICRLFTYNKKSRMLWWLSSDPVVRNTNSQFTFVIPYFFFGNASAFIHSSSGLHSFKISGGSSCGVSCHTSTCWLLETSLVHLTFWTILFWSLCLWHFWLTIITFWS
jgi:hypothetical protein